MLTFPEINCKWINHLQPKLDNPGGHDIWKRQPTAVNLSKRNIIKQTFWTNFTRTVIQQNSSKGWNLTYINKKLN